MFSHNSVDLGVPVQKAAKEGHAGFLQILHGRRS